MNEEQTNVSQQENVNDSIDYIEAINEMKRNSVSRDEYDKVVADNRKLLKSLMNGETVEADNTPKKTIDELRADFSKAETSLDGFSAALALRSAIIESGGADPFLPIGKKIMPTDEDIATANRVAAGLQAVVDYADGDPLIFANELSRVTIDTAPVRRRR